LAAIGSDQTHNHVKGGGFASTIRAQQTDHFAFFDFDGNIENHFAAAIGFLQMACF
jgi:hypothetical protein